VLSVMLSVVNYPENDFWNNYMTFGASGSYKAKPKLGEAFTVFTKGLQISNL